MPVYHVLIINMKVLICNWLDKQDTTSNCSEGRCILAGKERSKRLLATIQGRILDGLYAASIIPLYVNRKNVTSIKKVSKMQNFDRVPSPKSVWHNRTCHVQEKTLGKMVVSTKYGLCHEETFNKIKCAACSQAKQRKASANRELAEHAVTIPVRADIFGIM